MEFLETARGHQFSAAIALLFLVFHLANVTQTAR